MKTSQLMKIHIIFIALYLLYSSNLTAQANCSGYTDDLAVKALAVQPSSPQISCGKVTIIAEWEVISQVDYRNECHLSTINLAIPEPFSATTGTITIVANDGGNYFEPESGWEVNDNSIKIDLLPDAVIPKFEFFTLTVADMDILDNVEFTNVPITMSTSHVAVDADESNDILTIQTSTELADGPLLTDIQAACSDNELAINISAQTGTTAITSYSWTGPNGFTSSNEDPSFTITAEDKEAYTGKYYVTVTDENGCTAEDSIAMDGVNCLALPVELLSFTASANKDVVDLDWETATELNNSHFEVQRSTDGRSYTTIGQVKGAGTSSQVIGYAFTDEQPGPGKNYYRLKQVDYNGSFDYSPVRMVTLGADSHLSVFPNPVAPGSEITIQGQKIRTVKMYNMLGQIVVDKVYDQPQSSITISSGNLAQGIYTTRVNGVDEKRVVVK